MIRSSNMREKLLAAAIIGTFSSQAFSGTVTTDGADIVLKTKGGLEVSTSDKGCSDQLVVQPRQVAIFQAPTASLDEK